jgi:hypothetical protein
MPKRSKKSARRPSGAKSPKTVAAREPSATPSAEGPKLRVVDPSGSLGGRPTKYRPEFAHQAEHMCRLGATDFELCRFFGIAKPTLYDWMRLYPEFSASIKGAKALPDERVERSLYHRAIGYTHELEEVHVINGDVVIVKLTKHYAPDTAAGFIWLKNRKPLEWRDRHEVRAEVVDERSEMELTDEEIMLRLERIEAERKAARVAKKRKKA